MKLIIGLGNPGKKYEKNLHNVGFLAVDAFGDKYNLAFDKSMFNGVFTKKMINGEQVIIAKPKTFMNLSGEFIAQLMNFYKIDVEDVLIIFDDMELDFGIIRMRAKGSSGGHNGIKSIINHLHTQDFKRIKIGVGRPQNMPVINHVLSNFSNQQMQNLERIFTQTNTVIECFINDNFTEAMQRFSGKVDLD